MLIHISADGSGDYPSLAEAVRLAPPEATIYLAPGRYVLEQPLDVFRSLRLVGSDPATTVVSCAARGRVLGFSGNGVLAAKDITFEHTAEAASEAETADAVVALGGRVSFDQCRFAGAVGRRFSKGEGVGLRLLGDTSGAVTRCRAMGNDGPAFWLGDRARPLLLDSHCDDNGFDGVKRVVRHGPADPATFERFIDPVIVRMMADTHISGSVVVMVRDGKLFFAKGYGFADIARRTPMSPATTRVRVGSVTKAFTAMAVLQLVERRRLDLRDDVNGYLGGSGLPATFAQPVTVSDLLTHSGGLEDSICGTAARDPRAAVPLPDYLSASVPARIAPPGRIFSYSNHGMALAGLVVQRASGIPYERYVTANILDPLGMDRSGFVPPEAPGGDMAVGYRWARGRPAPRPLDYPSETPSAGLVTTGLDMARFMIAQLEGGRYRGVAIAQPDTIDLMHRQQFTNAAGLPGATYGFQERPANGLAVIQHTGDWGGFASAVFLVPDEHIGLFIASNGGDGSLREEVIGQILDRYFPQEVRIGAPPVPDGFAQRAGLFVGSYRPTRYAHRTFEKIFEFTPASEVTVTGDDEALIVRNRRFVEIQPLLFQEVDSGDRIAFATDLDGETAYLFEGTAAFERLAWYETFTFNRRLLIVVVFVFALSLLLWPGGLLLPKHRRRANGPRLAGAARLLAALVAALDLAFLAALGIALETVNFVYGVPWWFTALLVIPNVTAVLSLSLPALVAAAWWRRYWTVGGRLRYSVTATAALAFVWFCAYWNLLGMRR